MAALIDSDGLGVKLVGGGDPSPAASYLMNTREILDHLKEHKDSLVNSI